MLSICRAVRLANPESITISDTRNFWQATRRPLDISPREWEELRLSARGQEMLGWAQPAAAARL